jgi:hypothetical protein
MLKILGKEILFCKVCNRMYEESNKPHILSCGNTICHYCMLKYTKVGFNVSDPSCFFDISHHHILQEAPVNYTFLDILHNFKTNVKIQLNLTDDTLEKYFNPSIEQLPKYEGEKVNDKMSGFGKYTAREYIFTGLFEHDKPVEGTLTHRFTGEVFKGKFTKFESGTGEIAYPDGTMYYGPWSNFMRSGSGYIIFNNYDTYKGEFRNNEITGVGEFYCHAEKKRTIGTFKNGKEDGEMLIYINNKSKPIKTLCREGITITILEL